MPKTQRRLSIWDFYQDYSEHGMLLKTEQPVAITHFIELMHAPNSTIGRKLIADWVYLAETADLPEFSACTKAVHNWSDEILASFDCHYTNGFTEGCNNKTKVLKRVCFGVRNFARFRNRILHCAART